MKTITRFGVGAMLLVTAGLAAFTIADRTNMIGAYGFQTAEIKALSQPSAEYLNAIAAGNQSDAEDAAAAAEAVKVAGANPEASAR